MLMKWEKMYNMELNKFLEYANGGNVLYAESDIHKCMHTLSDEAQKITDKINNKYNTHEEKIALISELVGEKVDDSFNLFPPIYTDCGKNIHFGKNNFVNSGCCFQDQGGIYFGDNVLVGHQGHLINSFIFLLRQIISCSISLNNFRYSEIKKTKIRIVLEK